MFAIRPNSQQSGWWCLWKDDDVLGTYCSAEEAARAVHDRQTGDAMWDRLYGESIPAALTEWAPRYRAGLAA